MNWREVKKNPYWRHLFSKHKLRGKWVTWSLKLRYGWSRLGRVMFRWEYLEKRT